MRWFLLRDDMSLLGRRDGYWFLFGESDKYPPRIAGGRSYAKTSELTDCVVQPQKMAMALIEMPPELNHAL